MSWHATPELRWHKRKIDAGQKDSAFIPEHWTKVLQQCWTKWDPEKAAHSFQWRDIPVVEDL